MTGKKLRTTIDGVAVRTSTFSKGAERMRVPYTGVTAEARGPRKLALTVREATLLDPIGRKLGLQDVKTGDARFDRDFVVKSNLPEGARVWLHEEVRRRIALVPGYRFKLEDGRASAEYAGIEEDDERRTRSLEAVAALARGTKGLEDAWRQACAGLDGGRLRTSKRRWPRIAGHLRGHQVEVRLRRRKGDVSTVIRTDRALQGAEARADEPLLALGATLAVKSGVVVVTLPGICDDGDRLLACVEAAVGGGIEGRRGYR